MVSTRSSFDIVIVLSFLQDICPSSLIFRLVESWNHQTCFQWGGGVREQMKMMWSILGSGRNCRVIHATFTDLASRLDCVPVAQCSFWSTVSLQDALYNLATCPDLKEFSLGLIFLIVSPSSELHTMNTSHSTYLYLPESNRSSSLSWGCMLYGTGSKLFKARGQQELPSCMHR